MGTGASTPATGDRASSLPTGRMNAADEILGPTLRRGGADEVAVLFGDERMSFGQLDALTNRYGNALKPHVGRGGRVLLLLKDSPDLVAAYLGTMRIGAVAVALNTRSAAKDVAFAIDDSEASVLLLDDEFLPLYEEARRHVGHAPALVAVRGQAPAGLPSLAEIVASASEVLVSEPMGTDDMAFWMYTSGTTGNPKAAIHCHGDVLIGDLHLRVNLGVGPGDRLFSSSKLFFAFALGHILIGGLRAGATIILHDGWPDGADIARLVERYRPSVMFSVPTFYRNLLRDRLAEAPAFKTVRHYVSAGEGLPESLYRRWVEVTGTPIVEGIGTTETVFLMVAGTPADHRPGATGKPLPWVEARLLDPEERPVTETDAPGVLWIRMPSLCRGYWNQPEKTRAAFTDGWFRTGDMFSIDADGYWHHHGRGDDMLKISGQWVSPGEIEEAAVGVPGIVEACCVGIPNADGLVRLALFLIAEGGGSGRLEQQVRDKLLGTLSVYKCPRTILFVEDVPRTATGKVQRFRLRDMASQLGSPA